MKTIIHVNQAVIRRNTKTGETEAPLIARTYKGAANAQELDIVDNAGNVVASIVHRPHDPLSCGARVWIETKLKVVAR